MDDIKPMPRRNLAVGHFYNGPFQDACARHLPRIREVFFAWPGVLSCRPAPTFTPEVRQQLLDDLLWARANGIDIPTLCYCENLSIYGGCRLCLVENERGAMDVPAPWPRETAW